jgi:hypothetical protein
MCINWVELGKQTFEITFGKMASFNRFNKTTIEYSQDNYKPTMDFSSNYLDLEINTIIPFRDFLFYGTRCRFIYQMVNCYLRLILIPNLF